jgi:tetratricopeptide (TPR) repeat protein
VKVAFLGFCVVVSVSVGAQDRESEAVAALRAAAERGPLERGLAMQLAGVELSEGNLEAAEKLFLSVTERFPSAQALVNLARIRSRRRDPRGAADYVRRARELAPNSEEVLSAFARLHLTAASPVPALLALEPLVRMHPTVPEYSYLLGVAWMQVGDLAAATELLQQADRLRGTPAAADGLSPSRGLVLTALGLALNKQKRFVEAREILEESLELEPENVEAVAALAEAEEGLGELDAAERHARRALERDGGHATANLVIGMILMKKESYAEAKGALLKALAAEPESPKAHYQLSLAYARLGDRETSRRHVELYRQASRGIEERLRELVGRRPPAAEEQEP